MERTFFMIKPDGVGRGLVGEIVARLERKGLRLVAMKMMRISEQLARHHYEAHVDKPFFPGLLGFITSGPVVACVFEGAGAIATVRQLMGATDPQQAPPGTIRGDYALAIDCNCVHGSDGPEAARREIGLFFREEELVGDRRPEEDWVYPSGA